MIFCLRFPPAPDRTLSLFVCVWLGVVFRIVFALFLMLSERFGSVLFGGMGKLVVAFGAQKLPLLQCSIRIKTPASSAALQALP